MERSELIQKVRARLDEVSSGGDVIQSVGVEDDKPLDTLIGSVLNESAYDLLLTAPFSRLKITAAPAATTLTETSGAVSITLPDDFLRLVAVQLSDWTCPVGVACLPDSAIGARQKNVYLRGGRSKPVAVLEQTSGGHTLNLYSTEQKTPKLTRLDYIALCTAENITSPIMIEALCWIASAKVLTIQGNINLAQAATEHAKSLMQ